jgi:N-acetylmuramate 1-kinase
MPFLTSEALATAVAPALREIAGNGTQRIESMPGGASLRRYHRAHISGSETPTVVVMETGDPTHSDEVVKGAPTELPFLNVQRYLAAGQVPVPSIYRYDREAGLVYLEDLGDITFESRVTTADDAVRGRYYRLAIDTLVAMQRYANAHRDPACIAFGRSFDFDLLKWELDHCREYLIEAQGIALSPSEREELERQFGRMADELASAPRGFVHRDYQSRNLMVQDRDASPSLRLIDFQDALLGTAVYDLVGLLRDSYVSLAPALLDELVDYHIAQSGADAAAFTHLFNLQTAQRKLKDAGRFVFIERVKKIPGFMQHIPSSLEYVSRALSKLPDLAPVREILSRHFVQLR